MRRMLIGMAALLLAGQASAQSSAAVGSPLRSDEVALHIVARGEMTTRADRITIPVTVTGRGPTLPEARTAADAGVTRLTAALITAGVDRAAITTPGSRLGVANPLTMITSLMGGEGGAHPAPRATVTTLQVTVPDRATLDRAMQVIAAQDGVSAAAPKPMLRDEALAHHGAVTAAIARARHDADDYAEALGLKVARIAAVSNSAGLADGAEVLTTIMSEFQDKNAAPDTVTTRATAAVDFVLAPR